MKDPGLPDVVREVLLAGIIALSDDTDDRYLFVKAMGHQMEAARNSYERTSAELLVEPRYFTPAPTYGRSTA
jgi:hypothetical protein